jgi:hypothetical protein
MSVRPVAGVGLTVAASERPWLKVRLYGRVGQVLGNCRLDVLGHFMALCGEPRR